MALQFDSRSLEIFPIRTEILAQRDEELARIAQTMQLILPVPENPKPIERKRLISTQPVLVSFGELQPFNVLLSRTILPIGKGSIWLSACGGSSNYFEVARTEEGKSHLSIASLRVPESSFGMVAEEVFNEGIARLDDMLGRIALGNGVDPNSVHLPMSES